MTSRPHNINELLSGMLDGVLSAEEHRVVKEALEKDPTLQQSLNELAALRSSLLRGRQPGRLGASFASTVVRAAAERASYEIDSAPDWISLPPDSQATSPIIEKAAPSYAKLAWIPLGSLAAALTIALFAITLHRASTSLPEPTGSIATAEPRKTGPASSTSTPVDGSKEPSTNQSLADTTVGTPQSEPLDTNPKPFSTGSSGFEAELAMEGKNATKPAESENANPISDEPRGNDSSLAAASGTTLDATSQVRSNDSSKQDLARTPSTKPELASNSSNTKPEKSNLASPDITAYALMAVHVSIGADAIDNNALESILDKHNILSIDDLAISDEELDSLLTTGIAGKISSDGAGVYFLKGYAKNLSGAIEDLCVRHKEFPEFGINLTMDNSAKHLVHQLEEIEIGKEPAVATRVGIQTPNGFVATFARGSKTPKPMTRERREAYAPSVIVPSIDTNPISYLLLVVRKAPEVSDSSQLESSPADKAAD